MRACAEHLIGPGTLSIGELTAGCPQRLGEHGTASRNVIQGDRDGMLHEPGHAPGGGVRTCRQADPGPALARPDGYLYRRDKLHDLIALQVGPVRHTICHPTGDRKPGTGGSATQCPELDLPVGGTGSRPAPVLHVHPTSFCYIGDADPRHQAGRRDLPGPGRRRGTAPAKSPTMSPEPCSEADTAWSSPSGSPTAGG
jgi:hypothetical protein